MTYTDFTLAEVVRRFGLHVEPGDLFPDLRPVPPPVWVTEFLARSMRLALLSEKARSEYIIAPLLLAFREMSGDRVAIYSGYRLNVDGAQGLAGECDFLIARSSPLPYLQPPVITVVEAKQQDIEGGLGQCVAQMLGARVFNQKAGVETPCLYGCVTTGEAWQFLRLEGDRLTHHVTRYYINDVGRIFAALMAILAATGVSAAA